MQKNVPFNHPSIAVYFVHGTGKLYADAIELAHRLNLPLTDTYSKEFSIVLVHTGNRLELRQTDRRGAPGPVYVDFTARSIRYRQRHGGGIRQALARAVGIKVGIRPTVFDVTAGLGRDAFILASLGCNVTMVERSPIVAAMLEDGLNRALSGRKIGGSVLQRLHLMMDDSINLMKGISKEKRPEAIYLDPMYPHRSKSALNKKEMRILRAVIGEDQDAPVLLATSLRTARRRVIVKRPRLAAPIEGPGPTMAIRGKSSRFDIYLV